MLTIAHKHQENNLSVGIEYHHEELVWRQLNFVLAKEIQCPTGDVRSSVIGQGRAELPGSKLLPEHVLNILVHVEIAASVKKLGPFCLLSLL